MHFLHEQGLGFIVFVKLHMPFFQCVDQDSYFQKGFIAALDHLIERSLHSVPAIEDVKHIFLPENVDGLVGAGPGDNHLKVRHLEGAEGH